MDIVVSVEKTNDLFLHDLTASGERNGLNFRMLHTIPGRSLILDIEDGDKYIVDMSEVVLRILEELDK